MNRSISLFTMALLASNASAFAGGVSVDQSKVLDRWTLRLGGYVTGLDTKLRLDSPTGEEGTTVSLEDDLGFSNSESIPRINLSWIRGKRHEISAGWYKTDRDSRTTLDFELDWGDEVFPIDTDIGGFYKTEFWTLGYTYYFYTSEKAAFGVTGGIVWATMSAGLGVDVLGQDFNVEEDLSTDVPVPQLGFSGSTFLGKGFVFTGGIGYIAFNLDDWKGDVATAAVAFEHRTWKNFGFGVGYSYSAYDVDTEDANFLGNFEYTIGGLEIYGRAAW
jgi:hypothetical protein